MIKKINKNKNKNQMTKHKRILFVLSVVLLILFSIIITFLSTIYFVEAVNETIEMQKAFDLQKMESQKNLELQLEMNYLSSSMYGKGQEINSILSTNNFDSSIFDGYDYSRFIYGSIPEDNDGAGFIDLPKNAKKIYMRKSSDNIKYNKSDLIKVKNSKGNETIAEMIFYESDLREDFSLKTSKNQISDGQIVDAEVVLPGRFNSFQLRELKFNKNKSLKIEDLAHESISILGKNEIKAYAMNLDELNFTTGKYYDFAEGRELWKCKDWNFTLQQCFGSWVKIMDLIPGTEYSFDISPVDPAYVEVFDLNNAIDVDIVALDSENLVLAWVDGDVNNYVSFEIWNTRGIRAVDEVNVDTSGDNGDAVAVSSVNSSHFVVGWVDGPLDDLRHAGFVVDGSSYFASVALDTNIGTFSDVDVCSLGDRYAVVDANQNDADADFRIQSNSGASLVIETAADGTISPAANNQNLVSCSLFNSSVWVYAFFDDFDKDASVFVRSMTGVAVGAQLDIDTNVGETGQVAVAGLRGNRYAYVFYNSVNSSVYMTVRGLSGTTHTTVLGNTVIDSNAGTSSRVSVAEVEFSNQSYFAAAWFDQSDTTIKVGVYNGSGAQITAPFIVSSAPTVTFPIVSVTGTHSNLGYGLCNATFAIAYTNSSGNIVFRTYWYNGTTWNGTCPDYDPPVINIISPINNTVNKTNSIINFYYDVSDRSVVSSCSLYIDDVLNQTIYSVVKDSTINFTANLSNENYTWKIGCIDSSGNVANSSMNNLNVSWYMPIIQSLTSNSFIILNPGSTKNVECNASIYEGNGISDISIVNATFFRSNTSINGPLNNNTLYVNSSCTSISSSGNISNYTCSFQVYYYALNGSWNCTVNAFDVDDFSGTNTTNLTIDTLYALNLSNLLIDYGNISPGSNSSDKNINITNLGNMNLNITVKGYGGDDPVTGEGYAMRCVSGDNILIENHRYSTISGKSFNQKIPLTSSPVHLNLTIQKQTQPNAIMINSSYWQLNVPPMPSVTQCNGTIVFTVAAPY